jgi:hypothetical protein
MPRKGQFIATPNCKVEGCREPRHVYPGGGRSTYCCQHMRLRKGKFRPGFESMSGRDERRAHAPARAQSR